MDENQESPYTAVFKGCLNKQDNNNDLYGGRFILFEEQLALAEASDKADRQNRLNWRKSVTASIAVTNDPEGLARHLAFLNKETSPKTQQTAGNGGGGGGAKGDQEKETDGASPQQKAAEKRNKDETEVRATESTAITPKETDVQATSMAEGEEGLNQRLSKKFRATVALTYVGGAAAIGGSIIAVLTPAVMSASSPFTALINDPVIVSFFAVAIVCLLVAGCVALSMIPGNRQKRAFIAQRLAADAKTAEEDKSHLTTNETEI